MRTPSRVGAMGSRGPALSLGSGKERRDAGCCQDPEMGSQSGKHPSPDVSLHFLEPCIRTRTSTSWTTRSAPSMQESAGTCLNSEFALVSCHFCCFQDPCRSREGSSGKPLCFRRLGSFRPGVPLPSPTSIEDSSQRNRAEG